MGQKLTILLLALGVMLALTASNIEADFILCPSDTPTCTGTTGGDIITGTTDLNNIEGLEGDDSIFAGDNPVESGGMSVSGKESVGGFMFGVSRAFIVFSAENIIGGPGDDFISGGLGPDSINGDEGNDVILPGPDVAGYGQVVNGNDGNDTVYVLAGEITSCLAIHGGTGFDSVNLLGFGPFSAQPDFGMTGWEEAWLHVVDPIGGGDIFIEVYENGDEGTEIINGLPSPTVTLLPGMAPPPATNCEFSPIR